MPGLRILRRKNDSSWLFTERRGLERLPLTLPIRLRIGLEIYAGRAIDLSMGGLAVQVVESDPRPHAEDRRLAIGDCGAVELLIEDKSVVARMRVTRVQRRRGKAYVGMAIDNPDEAERVARRLAACGLCTRNAMATAEI